jgi:hypothetical protein
MLTSAELLLRRLWIATAHKYLIANVLTQIAESVNS